MKRTVKTIRITFRFTSILSQVRLYSAADNNKLLLDIDLVHSIAMSGTTCSSLKSVQDIERNRLLFWELTRPHQKVERGEEALNILLNVAIIIKSIFF